MVSTPRQLTDPVYKGSGSRLMYIPVWAISTLWWMLNRSAVKLGILPTACGFSFESVPPLDQSLVLLTVRRRSVCPTDPFCRPIVLSGLTWYTDLMDHLFAPICPDCGVLYKYQLKRRRFQTRFSAAGSGFILAVRKASVLQAEANSSVAC